MTLKQSYRWDAFEFFLLEFQFFCVIFLKEKKFLEISLKYAFLNPLFSRTTCETGANRKHFRIALKKG